jgi:hypothetical protein
MPQHFSKGIASVSPRALKSGNALHEFPCTTMQKMTDNIYAAVLAGVDFAGFLFPLAPARFREAALPPSVQPYNGPQHAK